MMMLNAMLLAVAAVGRFAQPNPDYRVSLDLPFKADLRRARGVTFDFRISDAKQCSHFSFYYKSGDGWTENENTTWQRKEEWTYTPESSSGAHAWIYNQLADNRGAS